MKALRPQSEAEGVVRGEKIDSREERCSTLVDWHCGLLRERLDGCPQSKKAVEYENSYRFHPRFFHAISSNLSQAQKLNLCYKHELNHKAKRRGERPAHLSVEQFFNERGFCVRCRKKEKLIILAITIIVGLRMKSEEAKTLSFLKQIRMASRCLV